MRWCRQIAGSPPSTWPAVSTLRDAAASRGLQDIWSSKVPDRLPLYPVMLLPAAPTATVAQGNVHVRLIKVKLSGPSLLEDIKMHTFCYLLKISEFSR